MAFRDDHDAALMRIDALEAELAQHRSRGEARERRVAELEAELRRARRQLKTAQPPEPTTPPHVRDHGKAAAIVVAILLVLVLGAGLMAMTLTNDMPTQQLDQRP